MSVVRERVDAILKILRIPPDLCWTTPEEFIKLLTKILTVEINTAANNEFVIVGHQAPGEDEKGKLWVRLAINGSFIGFYFFENGLWERIHNFRIDHVVWMHGDSRQIPKGFQLIDTGIAGITTDVVDHIKTFYLVNTAVVSPTVFKYFAVRYIGF